MIVVTGAAGFIGSNLVHALNARGAHDLLLVDNLERGIKYRNLLGARFSDFIDKRELLPLIERGGLHGVRAVLHQGACSSTTEWNGRYMLDTNYAFTKTLISWCIARKTPLVYASSAAVYGAGKTFAEARENEGALNVYGWSKQIVDDYVRDRGIDRTPGVVGLRYFNVYGQREAHKGSMASVAFHQHKQLLAGGGVKLFAGCDGYGDGEQRRDFVHVDDVVDVNLFFLDHPEKNGIFNVGSGRAQTFNDVARAVVKHHGRGDIEYIPFPAHLVGKYQSFTEADLRKLRAAGYTRAMRSVEEGVPAYLGWLDRNPRLWETQP